LSPDLVTALRAETPSASGDLRQRVAAITATTPPTRRFTLRRLLPVAVPVAAGLSLAVALAVGLNTAIKPPTGDEGSTGSAVAREVAPPAQSEAEKRPMPLGSAGADDATASQQRAAAPTPSAGRAQDYRATLTLLVDSTSDLSTTTQKALRTARRLGGYVVSVDYETPQPTDGVANVRLRIPVSRVQAAIVEFSGLGRILAQNTQIADLQQGLDQLTRQIRALEQLAAGTRGAERRRVLDQIAALRNQRAETRRQAAFATIDLNLTTHEPEEVAPPAGRFDRALSDAVGILVAELVIVAYALIVASPLLILLLAAFFGSRAYRRHADQRLLERA
jgi:Domain of unknown function (DUF4349)